MTNSPNTNFLDLTIGNRHLLRLPEIRDIKKKADRYRYKDEYLATLPTVIKSKDIVLVF